MAELHRTILKKYKTRENFLAGIMGMQAEKSSLVKAIDETVQPEGIPETEDPEAIVMPGPPDLESGAWGSPPEDSESSSFCFISSEIFGLDSKETNTLRHFRDRYLEKHAIGKTLIHTYYLLSPDAVYLLKHSDTSKYLTTTFLNKLITVLDQNK